MKQEIRELLQRTVENLAGAEQRRLPADLAVQVEHSKDKQHGDFASNIAMVLAGLFKKAPRNLAEDIVQHLPETDFVEKLEIAGPGFINFFLKTGAINQTIPLILTLGEKYGGSDEHRGEKVLLEYVSANPTGPLHIGHGRGAAYGSVMGNLLKSVGYEVSQEYYVNDAGRQMDILTVSIWLRYLEKCGQRHPFPERAYQGEYVQAIAEEIYNGYGKDYEIPEQDIYNNKRDQLDAESQLDQLIDFAKISLGEKRFKRLHGVGLGKILDDIKSDLKAFGVNYQTWFSEHSLIEEQVIDACVEQLEKSGDVYDKDGAKWFKSTEYGDEKDRVVRRKNGEYTYFAADIGYHKNKFDRGFDRAINIWGSDHHGYIKRVKAALEALGEDPGKLEIRLVQFATLYRGEEKLPMSTRSGEFVTLRALREETGKDAARFFYVMRKSEQHLDFDLELAKSDSNENPLYYIQYTHARICNVYEKLKEKGYMYDQGNALEQLHLLNEAMEQKLIHHLSRYPDVIVKAARLYEPHSLCYYLKDLAGLFHGYYEQHHFIVDEANLRDARMALILAAKQVINNGLSILGVSAPVKM